MELSSQRLLGDDVYNALRQTKKAPVWPGLCILIRYAGSQN